jgi:hypothetical protein
MMAARAKKGPNPSADRRNSERRPVERPSTLRHGDSRPVDVIVNDLSSHGFSVLLADPPAVGSTISIGLPGIGSRIGVVARAIEGGVGCRFATPLDAASVASAFAADPVVAGVFTTLPTPELDLDHEPHVEKWHPAARTTLIVALTSAAWGALFLLL